MARLGVLDKSAEPRSAAKDRAAKVLMTAADLIYRNGFDATSVNNIAKAVNLKRPACTITPQKQRRSTVQDYQLCNGLRRTRHHQNL